MKISKNLSHLKLFIGALTVSVLAMLFVIGVGGKSYADAPTPSTQCAQPNLSTDDGSTTSNDPSDTSSTTPDSSDSCTPTTDTDPDTTAPDTDQADNSTTPSCGTITDEQPSPDTDTTDSTINNCLNQSSTSGQTIVEDTDGGLSDSGNSDDSLNQVNQISNNDNSSSPTVGFTDNLYGDQTGNIEIDPTTAGTQQGSDNTNLPTDTSSNSTINNNDNVTAQSGDATISDGGNGGSANSGNSNVAANIVNLINTAISDNQSFEGTINIYGNLYGDILLPQQLVDELLSPSAGTSAAIPSDNSDMATVNNNVNLIAQSGSALVDNDGSYGAATSGDASTFLNIANYIDNLYSANNLFLVIINVSGQWYGYILGAAPQSDMAILGNDMLNTNSTQSSGPTTSVNTAQETINNNINLAAYSGNAAVYNQGNGGSATSGNAEVSANVVNFISDTFNITGWFGILFINVFGNWYGSLSTYDPSAVNQSPQTITPAFSNAIDESGDPQFKLVAASPPSSGGNSSNSGSGGSTTINLGGSSNKIKLASTGSQAGSPSNRGYYLLALLSLIPIAILLVLERFVFKRNKGQQ